MGCERFSGQNRFINREPAFDADDDEGGIQASIPAADASEGYNISLRYYYSNMRREHSPYFLSVSI